MKRNQKPEQLPFTWKGNKIFLHKKVFNNFNWLHETEFHLVVASLNQGYAAAQKDQEAKAQKLMDKYGI